jgi:uncharacterized membrane protein YjjB (DUF3815 family)
MLQHVIVPLLLLFVASLFLRIAFVAPGRLVKVFAVFAACAIAVCSLLFIFPVS